MKPHKKNAESKRLHREKVTLRKMISLHCRRLHDPQADPLCLGCQELESYAHQRIARCPFGAKKPTCARCTVHCYQPEKRDAIRQVMRYSGPRMLVHHPLLTLQHMIDALLRNPSK